MTGDHLLALVDVNIIGKITPPPSVVNLTRGGGAAGLSTVMSNAITIIIVFGIIAALFMIVLGAIQWIISGGDKEAVSKARSRIMYAVIGLVLLSLIFLIFTILSSITGITLLDNSVHCPSKCQLYDDSRKMCVTFTCGDPTKVCNPTTGSCDAVGL